MVEFSKYGRYLEGNIAQRARFAHRRRHGPPLQTAELRKYNKCQTFGVQK
jgi:hypothetical protein